MRVISKRALREFSRAYPVSASSLAAWHGAIRYSSPRNPAGMRAVFDSVDFVGEFTVFNIDGNKFRLIGGIDYRCQVVYVKHILTHKMYDEGKWKV